MNLRETTDKLIDAHRQIVNNSAGVIAALKDQSIPLADRWSAYVDLVDEHILVKEKGYGDGFIDVLGDNLTLYDDFGIDRGQTTTFPEMYEQIMEASDVGNQYLADACKANLEKWQEAVLQSGYSGFCYDW